MKVKWGSILFLVFLSIFVPYGSANAPLKLFVNGQPVTSVGIPVVRVLDNRLYVDIHAISSELKLDVDSNHENTEVYISNKGEPQSKVVATLREAKAVLYATEREGQLEKFRLVINGATSRHFPYWRSSSFRAFWPELFYEDINHDGTKEIVVILTTGHGTGIVETEAHVIQSKVESDNHIRWEEELIENPLAILHKQVRTRLMPKGKVEIMIGNKKTIDSKQEHLGPYSIEFSVYNGELVAYMKGQLSPQPAGAILITYGFKDGMYQAKKLEYIQFYPDFKHEGSFQ
jgi:hypothetical protein